MYLGVLPPCEWSILPPGLYFYQDSQDFKLLYFRRSPLFQTRRLRLLFKHLKKISRVQDSQKTHIFVFNKFTHSSSSALVHAFSHAIRAKSLLFLTLISEFVLPFLPPSLWVDDQLTSLVVELPFFHICQILFLWIPLDSAGMTRIQQKSAFSQF